MENFEDYRYYDQGWNARINGHQFCWVANLDWQEGWDDADEAIENGDDVKLRECDHIRFADLPALHGPLEGGNFKGLTTDRDGRHLAVVLLPQRGVSLTWDQAVAWAESVGGMLPTRPVSAMLYDHSRDSIGPGLYWCAEPWDADGSSAWYQTFNDGYQDTNRKSYERQAIAVRLIEVVA